MTQVTKGLWVLRWRNTVRRTTSRVAIPDKHLGSPQVPSDDVLVKLLVERGRTIPSEIAPHSTLLNRTESRRILE